MAKRNRESGLACVQPVEVADGALRLHGNVVSVIKQLPTDSDKLCDEVLNSNLSTVRDFQAINAIKLFPRLNLTTKNR